MFDARNIKTQLKKGIFEMAVLKVLSKKSCYASSLISELKKVDLIVAEGTIYPMLSRLRKEELIDYRWVESEQGPPRKYYELNEKGRNKLTLLEKAWEEINNSIFLL